MSWEDEDWENYNSSEEDDSEDEALKQLKAEAAWEKNKPKKQSVAERKAAEEEKRKAEQAKIDAEVRELRRKQQGVRAKLGANATEAQVNQALQEASEIDAVRDLFAVSASEAAEGQDKSEEQAAVATSCDINLLDLIGEEEHMEFGEALAGKLADMSTPPYITAMVTTLLKKLETVMTASDYQKIGKTANVLQNELTKKAKEAQKKSKKKTKHKPKLNTGSKSAAKNGGYEDFLGDDGAGNYYDDHGDYGW